MKDILKKWYNARTELQLDAIFGFAAVLAVVIFMSIVAAIF